MWRRPWKAPQSVDITAAVDGVDEVTVMRGEGKMATHTFDVPNISCQHCVRRISQALNAVPGVRTVSADVATKKVTVTYEGPETLDRVRAALREIGYPPAE